MDGKISASILKEEHVRTALTADKGSDAKLESWTTESFTDKGDNYASDVRRIKAIYFLNGQQCQVSYVVKSGIGNPEDLSGEESHSEFTRESGLYIEILPRLNSVLKDCETEDLKVPKCFFISLKYGEELIIFEDLRVLEYKIADRRIGLGVNHVNLVLKELAKLHASSYLLQKKSSDVDLKDQYSNILVEDDRFKASAHDTYSLYIQNAGRVLKEFGGNKKADEWIQRNVSNCGDIVYGQFIGSPPFDVVCHGDCWSNNYLFRYNENNEPSEVVLLDFQGTRKSSLASDIVELMYRSLDGITRKSHLEYFFTTYFKAFRRVLEASGNSMPFTLPDLREEYKKRLVFGLMQGLVSVPWMVSQEGLQSYEGPAADERQLEAFMKQLEVKTVMMLNSDSALRQRFLSIFDDMIEAGVM